MFVLNLMVWLILHINCNYIIIFTLIFPIWMENIIKMKNPLGQVPVSYMQKETYPENQQNDHEI